MISSFLVTIPQPPPHPVSPFSPPLWLYEGVHLPTHQPHHSSIPLHWGIKPPQYQGPPFPLIPDKAILCYICSWSHASLHVYMLVV